MKSCESVDEKSLLCLSFASLFLLNLILVWDLMGYKCDLCAQNNRFRHLCRKIVFGQSFAVDNGKWTLCLAALSLLAKLWLCRQECSRVVNDNVINSHFYTLGLAPITLMNEGTCQMDLLCCHFYDTLNVWCTVVLHNKFMYYLHFKELSPSLITSYHTSSQFSCIVLFATVYIFFSSYFIFKYIICKSS